MEQICVGNIVAIETGKQHEHLIALIDKVTRKYIDDFAERFRIAGPGDLDSPKSDVLFLPYWLLNREELLSMVLDRSDSNAPNQASRFTLHGREAEDSETLF